MKKQNSKKHYVICVKNRGYRASLEVRKVYQAIPDAGAAKHGLIRVIDESGEDYLYPGDYFLPIEVPKAAQEALSTGT